MAAACHKEVCVYTQVAHGKGADHGSTISRSPPHQRRLAWETPARTRLRSAAIFGWSDIRMAMRYTHAMEDAKRRAVEAIAVGNKRNAPETPSLPVSRDHSVTTGTGLGIAMAATIHWLRIGDEWKKFNDEQEPLATFRQAREIVFGITELLAKPKHLWPLPSLLLLAACLALQRGMENVPWFR